MTSTHGLIEPPPQKKRRIQPDSKSEHATPTPGASGSAGAAAPRSQQPTTGGSSTLPIGIGDTEREARVGEPEAETPKENEESGRDDIQILDPASLNPIISYRGQYFTCTWSDMIGTNMFFTQPSEELPSAEPLLRGTDFNLQGVSRIKLIAQRSKVVAQPGPRKRARATDEEPHSETEQEGEAVNGKALGTLRSNNAATNIEIRKQASFLERLIDIKRKKGEKDNVRTAFPLGGAKHRASRPTLVNAPENSQAPTSSGHIAEEIEELNRRVVRGDRNALFRLEEIYEQMEDEQQGPRPTSPPMSETPSTARNTPAEPSGGGDAGG